LEGFELSENQDDKRYESARRNITEFADYRRNRRWPEKIVANLSAGDLDTFIYQNVVAARLVMELREQGEGLLVVRDFDKENAQARDAISSVNLPFHSELRLAPAPEGLFPLDWFDEGHGAPVMSDNPQWTDGRWMAAELLLMPQMLDFDAATAKDFGDVGALFLLPKDVKERVQGKLIELGLNGHAWIAVVDLEQPKLAEKAIAKIVKTGGQAIVLGDASGVTSGAGIVVLPMDDDWFECRMASIAMARFMLGRDHYHTTLASAFATPCAMIEGEAYLRRIWRSSDIFVEGEATSATVGGIVEEFLQATKEDSLLSPLPVKFRRGELDCIPLIWPEAAPVIQVRPTGS